MNKEANYVVGIIVQPHFQESLDIS